MENKIEKQILDAINAGLGLLKTGQESIEKMRKDLDKALQDMIQKGASDSSENSVKLRDSVNKILKDVQDMTNSAQKSLDDSIANIRKQYSDIEGQIKNLMNGANSNSAGKSESSASKTK